MRSTPSRLGQQEIERVRRAADYAGLPWQAICERPQTARQFCRRVEAEMEQRSRSEAESISSRKDPIKRAHGLALWVPFHPNGLLYKCAALAATYRVLGN